MTDPTTALIVGAMGLLGTILLAVALRRLRVALEIVAKALKRGGARD